MQCLQGGEYGAALVFGKKYVQYHLKSLSVSSRSIEARDAQGTHHANVEARLRFDAANRYEI
jgi:hypothetical protein